MKIPKVRIQSKAAFLLALLLGADIQPATVWPLRKICLDAAHQWN